MGVVDYRNSLPDEYIVETPGSERGVKDRNSLPDEYIVETPGSERGVEDRNSPRQIYC